MVLQRSQGIDQWVVACLLGWLVGWLAGWLVEDRWLTTRKRCVKRSFVDLKIATNMRSWQKFGGRF